MKKMFIVLIIIIQLSLVILLLFYNNELLAQIRDYLVPNAINRNEVSVPSDREENLSNDSLRKSDLKRLQAALELYYSDHRTYPASLSELEGDYISELSVDPVTKQHYKYEKKSPQSYVLVAILRNGMEFSVNNPE
jgi:hypothetical protein